MQCTWTMVCGEEEDVKKSNTHKNEWPMCLHAGRTKGVLSTGPRWVFPSLKQANVVMGIQPEARGHHSGRHVAVEAGCVGTKISECFSFNEASTWTQWHTPWGQHPGRHGAPEAWYRSSCLDIASLPAGTKSPQRRSAFRQCPDHQVRA